MCIICNVLNTPLSQLISQTIDTPTLTKGAEGVGDSLYPGFGNGGYDVQHYNLDLNVTSIETSRLNGIATIEARAIQNLSSFNLDFIGFTIDSITVNGKPAEFNREGQELTITPAEPLYTNDTFTVEVEYNGSPEQTPSVTLPVTVGWVIFDGGSFVRGEPDSAATYYPVNDHPIDKASYTFRVTVPEPFEVAANGVLEKTIDNGGSTTYVFEACAQMASYLATVNISNGFNVETEEGPNGILIRNYFANGIPEHLLEPFELQPEMLAFFNETFGPYPFEVYGSVVMNTQTRFALETQTLSIFGVDRLGVTPDYIGGFTFSTEELVAHELAHQWFGDSISLTDWGDIWLNESLATYAQGLWIEYSQGRETFDQWITNKYNTVVDAFDELVSPGEPRADDLFNRGVYHWGALGLHALRLDIGDDAFFGTLRTYYDRFKDSNATPDNLIEVAEDVSGQELNPFFDRWFYSEYLPPIPEMGLSFLGSTTVGEDTDTVKDDLNLGEDKIDLVGGLSFASPVKVM